MAHALPGCSLKVDRAEEHFRALHAETGRFAREEEPHAYVGEIDVERSLYIVRIKSTNPPPPEWSLIVGDFVHNLRSALDHMVWQLVKANGLRPTRSNAFPIFSQKPIPNDRSLARWNAMLRGVHPYARAIINSIQPHRAPKGPRRHALRNLRELSNEDKHRVVLQRVGAIAPVEPRLDITAVRDVEPIESYEIFRNRPLEAGDIALQASIKITGPDPKVDLKGEIPFNVGFGRDLVALQGLNDIFDGVDSVIAYASTIFFGVPVDAKPLAVRLGHL